jgi:hypothetical protein
VHATSNIDSCGVNRVGELAFAPEHGSADAVVVKCGTPKSALQFRLARCLGRVAV